MNVKWCIQTPLGNTVTKQTDISKRHGHRAFILCRRPAPVRPPSLCVCSMTSSPAVLHKATLLQLTSPLWAWMDALHTPRWSFLWAVAPSGGSLSGAVLRLPAEFIPFITWWGSECIWLVRRAFAPRHLHWSGVSVCSSSRTPDTMPPCGGGLHPAGGPGCHFVPLGTSEGRVWKKTSEMRNMQNGPWGGEQVWEKSLQFQLKTELQLERVFSVEHKMFSPFYTWTICQ